jgi:hypothetical protein
MAEMDAFERRVTDTLLWYADEAAPTLDAATVAHRAALGHPRRAGSGLLPWRLAAIPRLAWLLLLAGLLVALVGGMLIGGSQVQRRLPAVMPIVLPAYECPPGSDPDKPGPVDQARPPTIWTSGFDRRAGKLVVLASADSVSETWTFDVCTNTWTQMHPDRQPPDVGMSDLVYDVDSDLTIGIHEPQGPEPRTGRVWAYDLEADAWTELGVAPTFNTGFYDPVSGLMVGGVSEDLWYYDVETDAWTPISQATHWEDLDLSAYAYDASVDRIVVYGGAEGVVDMRLFDLRTGTWSRPAADTPHIETAGIWGGGYTVVYDEAAERSVVVGALQWGVYDATTDQWELLFPPGADPWYDAVNWRLIVSDTAGAAIPVSGDIVAFDLVTREWTVLLASAEEQPAPTLLEPGGRPSSSPVQGPEPTPARTSTPPG